MDFCMEDVDLYDVTTNKSYTLRVDSETAKKARKDITYATELLQRYLNAHEPLNNRDDLHDENIRKDSQESDQSFSQSQDTTSSNMTFWSRNETLELINAYDHFKEHFNNAKKRKHVWNTIATFLESKGIKKTEKIIENKWKNLLRTYKVIKDQNNKTGRGAVRFQFMEEMENLLGKRPQISSPDAVGVGLAIGNLNVDREQGTSKEATAVKEPLFENQHKITQATVIAENSMDESNNTSKRKKSEENNSGIKTKYMKLKIEELKSKKDAREAYLKFLMEEKLLKREREERLIKLKERELEIEDRKVKAMEAMSSSSTPLNSKTTFNI